MNKLFVTFFWGRLKIVKMLGNNINVSLKTGNKYETYHPSLESKICFFFQLFFASVYLERIYECEK